MKKFVKSNKNSLILALILVFISSVFSTIVQFNKGEVLDNALARDKSITLFSIISLILFIFLEIIFHYFYDQYRAAFTVNCISQLRTSIFKNTINNNYVSFYKNTKGEFLSKYTNDVEMIQNSYFATIPLLIEIIIKIILVSIGLFILDWRIAIVTLVLLTTPLYIPKIIDKKLQKAKKEYSEAFENNLSKVTDWLAGFEIIKNYSIESRIIDKFTTSNKYTMQKALKNKRINYTTNLITTLISYLSYFIILTLSATFVYRQIFTAGDFFIAIGMIDQLSYPLIALSVFIQDLISIKPICNEIMNIAEIKEDDESKRLNPTPLTVNDNILFDNITYGYNEENPLISDFSLLIQKNQKNLIQGRSGTGKTTLINLLLKYYTPDKGTIYLDNIPIQDIDNLFGTITIVRQEAFLFNDTLKNNLTMYSDISDEVILDVLEKVNLHKFANLFSLNMDIAEGGNNLSGGEKKRLCIARALLRNTNVLIFDEPLANLDNENVSTIEDILLNINDRTLIIVSHQFSESKLNQFDKIIKLNA